MQKIMEETMLELGVKFSEDANHGKSDTRIQSQSSSSGVSSSNPNESTPPLQPQRSFSKNPKNYYSTS